MIIMIVFMVIAIIIMITMRAIGLIIGRVKKQHTNSRNINIGNSNHMKSQSSAWRQGEEAMQRLDETTRRAPGYAGSSLWGLAPNRSRVRTP